MIETAALVIFPALMAYAAASDLLTMTIPNRVSIVLLAGFCVMALLGGLSWQSILLHGAAGLAVLVVTFTFFAFGWIGGGDAKLAAATALWLGFETIPDYLTIAAIAGGVLTGAVLVLRRWPLPAFASRWTWISRIHDHDSGVPYGIALAGAALAVYPHSQLWSAALSH